MMLFKKKPEETPKTPPPTGRERREHRRFNKSFILKYFIIDNPQLKYEITQLKNISRGGICFVSSAPIEGDVRLGIELKTPYLSNTTYLEGVVLESSVKVEGILYETRLQFDKLTAQSQLTLNQLIEFFQSGENTSYE
jgi:hypothetical protein